LVVGVAAVGGHELVGADSTRRERTRRVGAVAGHRPGRREDRRAGAPGVVWPEQREGDGAARVGAARDGGSVADGPTGLYGRRRGGGDGGGGLVDHGRLVGRVAGRGYRGVVGVTAVGGDPAVGARRGGGERGRVVGAVAGGDG